MRNVTKRLVTMIMVAMLICLVATPMAAAEKIPKVNGIKGYATAPKEPTLNALVNSPWALDPSMDERYFFSILDREDLTGEAFVRYTNASKSAFVLKPGHTYFALVYCHNDSAAKAAKDVMLSCVLPKKIKAGKTVKLKATITGSNLTQSPIKNALKLTAKQDIKITYVEGSAGADGDEEFVPVNAGSLFSKKGVKIGSWQNGGESIGGNQSTNVEFEFKVSKAK